MLVNDIENVKTRLLSLLPTLLNFSDVIERIQENYESADFQGTLVTLKRQISNAEQQMTNVIMIILDHVATLAHVSLQNKISNYYRDEQRGRVNVSDRSFSD